METIIGIIVSVIAVAIAMFFKGISPAAFANPAALSIILLGTVAVILIATPMENLKNLPKLFGILVGKSKIMTNKQVIDIIMDLADTARKEGIVAVEKKTSSIEDPFIVHGVEMILDGAEASYIADTLDAEIAAMTERHERNATIFSQAGTYAPTLGVMGAVMGLIAALGNMNDTEALGHAISAAFMATMLGIFTGYVLWHPFGNKLKQKSKQEATVKRLMLEGIIGISEGQNPKMLKERLLIMLPESERAVVNAKE